jgi:hypothetical protein
MRGRANAAADPATIQQKKESSTMKKLSIFCALAALAFAPHAGAVTARILCGFTPRAESINGGMANLQTRITNALISCDEVHRNSQTWVDWDIAGWHRSGIADNRAGNAILNDVTNNTPLRDKARSVSANMICMTADTNDVGGIAWQPGKESVVDAHYVLFPYYSHELGHNYNADHGHGLCWMNGSERLNTILQLNYCSGGRTISWYSNPAIYKYNRYLGDSSHNNALRINDTRHTRSNSWY